MLDMVGSSSLKALSYTKQFHSVVPRELQKALTKSIFESFRNASEHCYSTFRRPIAKDASGPYRHAKIEEEWCSIAERFPDTVRYSVKPYRNKTTGKKTGSYIELTIGNVKLTHACVRKESSRPRDADFRNTLARDSQQSFWSEESATPRRFLYAILLTGVDRASQDRSRPAFCCIRFPNESFSGYVEDPIDLFKAFDDLVSEYVDVKKDMVKDLEVKPRVRRQEEKA